MHNKNFNTIYKNKYSEKLGYAQLSLTADSVSAASVCSIRLNYAYCFSLL